MNKQRIVAGLASVAMAAAVVAAAAYLRLFLVYLYDRALEQQFVGLEVVDGVFLVDEGANES